MSSGLTLKSERIWGRRGYSGDGLLWVLWWRHGMGHVLHDSHR